MKKIILMIFISAFLSYSANAQFEKDTIKTSKGNLVITFYGHASLIFQLNNYVIYADPVSRYADFSKQPKADIILITHEHGDHFEPKVIEELTKKGTSLIYTKPCSEELKGGTVLNNGDSKTVYGIKIEAVPAYNIVHMRENDQPFHKKGDGNGYVVTFGNKRVYIAGDTENIPEMKNLKNIDIAFLPMNLPYTMTPEMVADAVRMFNPKILYPYHYGNTDVNKLIELLKNKKDLEIRIRKMN
jgi:L-ascorbate metabolism protein UlaG (beta-lactamase superfamily)